MTVYNQQKIRKNNPLHLHRDSGQNTFNHLSHTTNNYMSFSKLETTNYLLQSEMLKYCKETQKKLIKEREENFKEACQTMN